MTRIRSLLFFAILFKTASLAEKANLTTEKTNKLLTNPLKLPYNK
jgi:hypothetical protein